MTCGVPATPGHLFSMLARAGQEIHRAYTQIWGRASTVPGAGKAPTPATRISRVERT